MNNSFEKLCLKWNEFQENMVVGFAALREDKEFADVTLACEDGGQQVTAHKVVLASASPFFMDLLKKINHAHPLIYLKGARFADLIAIVDFLYLGEANVLQEDLDTFLSLADDLKLKGLSGSNSTGQKSETKPKPKPRKKPNLEEGELDNNKDTIQPDKPQTDENLSEQTPETENVLKVKVKEEELDNQIKSMMGKSEVNIDSSGRHASICKVCGKEGQWPNIKNHIEANHVDGITHTCKVCGKTSRSRHGLILHNFKHHRR